LFLLLDHSLKKYRKDIKQLYFATCCGNVDEKKDETFGYGKVFKKIEEIKGDAKLMCKAFPIVLALPEDKRDNDELIMKTRLNDSLEHLNQDLLNT
jgi:hypothetical protein